MHSVRSRSCPDCPRYWNNIGHHLATFARETSKQNIESTWPIGLPSSVDFCSPTVPQCRCEQWEQNLLRHWKVSLLLKKFEVRWWLIWILDSLRILHCSEILRDKNGSAVDAAIAVTFCLGVVTPQSSGLGGGMFMTIYSGGQMYTLNARETAPEDVNPDY